jgi:hypothetical protein
VFVVQAVVAIVPNVTVGNHQALGKVKTVQHFKKTIIRNGR